MFASSDAPVTLYGTTTTVGNDLYPTVINGKSVRAGQLIKNGSESIQVLTKVQEKGKLGYACARNLRKLMDAAKEYMEIRDQLLAEFGEDQGNGKYGFEPDKG